MFAGVKLLLVLVGFEDRAQTGIDNQRGRV